jgi:low temperature requirement protein LtrA
MEDSNILRYVIVCVEALAVITISCIWRVVSFKHTHLVERVGLLTLIIMGEGILGMTKSVSQILQNSTSVSSSDIGTVISAVLLIVGADSVSVRPLNNF